MIQIPFVGTNPFCWRPLDWLDWAHKPYINWKPTCETKEWWNFSATCEARNLSTHNVESPYKAGNPSPLRGIPGGDNPQIIKPDLMRNFNLGMGADMAVSTIYALCRMGVFDDDGTSIQKRLGSAFDTFETWCAWNRRTPTIKCFDANKLQLKSKLGFSNLVSFF